LETSLLSILFFADGAAAILISGRWKNSLEMGLSSVIYTLKKANKITEGVADFGFEMTLTVYSKLVKTGNMIDSQAVNE
jgi:predicted naringenin-chalcone synthase